ncbi:MAG: hypothetical protein ABSB34_09520 [Candidatus Limnocylindrales bacterium]
MNSQLDRWITSAARPAAGLFVAALLVADCVSAGAGAGSTPSASPSGSTPSASPSGSTPSASPSGSTPSASPSGSDSANGFYLRAWQTQALAPQYTFSWLPAETISDGKFIDGMVAIPMIYPGPIYVGLSQRPITAKGIDEIVAEARADGLLGDKSDFNGTPMPGSITANIRLVVDGVNYDLTGPLPTDATQTSASPGTTGAFTAFWNRLANLSGWLGAELGQSSGYSPSSIAVMLTPPADASGGIAPTQTPWPLSGTFATFGSPMGVAGYRCGVVSGPELATLLPVVQASDALTQFVDSSGVKMSLQVRVLLPGESGPCA